MWSGISIKSTKQKPQPLDDSVLMKKPSKKITKQSDNCISVFCRIRPLQIAEESNKSLAIIPEENSIELVADGLGRPTNKKYTFTQLFMSDSQADVIKRLCDPVLAAVQEECKGGLIFAYGVTSSGKTHTVLGTDTEPGILQYLFRQLPKPFSLTAVEVYNDQFFPLIGAKSKIYLIESCGRLEFRNYQPHKVTSENMNSIMEEIKNSRAQRSTYYNLKSSRSHAIFRIVSAGKVIGVVDLAGSQRVREGCSSEETTNINKSLLTLGRCIKCLREKSDKTIQIPFRQSRLTMALAQYFNTDFKLVMVVNINQAKSLMGETVNVLEYAAIAKDIKPNMTPTKSRFKNINYSQIKTETLIGPEECKTCEVPPKSALAQSKLKLDLQLKDPSQLKDIIFSQDAEKDKPNKVLRQYIIQNNLHLLKKQYYEKHRILNDDFNIFFDKEIQEDNERDQEFFKRLKQPSVMTVDDRQTKPMATTSTCVNTNPIPEPRLQSAFKRKTHEEYQEEYREWLVAEKAKFTDELQQQAVRREILERMYQDEMDELKRTRDNAHLLQTKLDQEIRKRDKMELEVQDQIRNETQLQKSVFQEQLEQERQQIKAKLHEEYLIRKELERTTEERIKRILEEKKQYEKKAEDQRQELIHQLQEMVRKHDQTRMQLEEFRKRAENQNHQVIQTEDNNKSSIKQKPTNQNVNDQNIKQRATSLKFVQQKGTNEKRFSREASASRQKNIEQRQKRVKSKDADRRKKYKSLNRKSSPNKQEEKEDKSHSSHKKQDNEKKRGNAKSVRFEDTRDPTPLKMRLRPRTRQK